MNLPAITAHLDRKFYEFLLLFDDKDLRDFLQANAYFAGGCIYCLANDKQVKDYDLFLIDAKTAVDRLKALPLWKCITEYALSRGKFQLVVKYFGEPEACVSEFDFKHNMHYYVPFSGAIKTVNNSFSYLHTNRLIFNEGRARDIEGVALRIQKFVERGMTISQRTERKIRSRVTPDQIHEYRARRSGNRHHY